MRNQNFQKVAMFTNGKPSIGININHRFAWYFIRRKTKSQSGLQFLQGQSFEMRLFMSFQLDRPFLPQSDLFGFLTVKFQAGSVEPMTP